MYITRYLKMNKLFNREEIINQINSFCTQHNPFVFVIDYKAEKGAVLSLLELGNSDIFCSINGIELNPKSLHNSQCVNKLEMSPIPFIQYKKSFDRVVQEIRKGNSYLLNLTFATPLGRNLDLKQIYANSSAPYKMLFNDEFLFYSPEPFIKICDNKIYSFPMKGTIDAKIENAESKLLENIKEKNEHNTIVDLIRNDLSMIARGVKVDRFRYIEQIKTSNGEIFQTSSQISGNLNPNWNTKFGDMLFSLLPAGSICGAPKQKTVEIIDACELSQRGFYCGVMGVFDGTTINSCVIIRYIEKDKDGNFYYRSGGGITSLSDAEEEYNELIKKIYVPII